MKRKTGVMILLLVCFFISISAVSASENIDIEHSVYNSSIDPFSENAEILGSKVKTIEELDNEIQNSQPESTIKLKNDYIISNGTTIDGIDIYTNITIDGQGHTIDGSSSDMDYLFRIYEDNVVLKNIRFINLESIYSYNSIEWLGDNGKIVNCTFINNYAYDGGCIDWTGSDGQIINCEFINNTAENGGAIYYYGNYGTISNCTFINNFASEGGAICIVGRNNRIDRCSFDSNTADDGGAIYWDNIYGNLTNSTFTDNCAENGGAIYTSSFKSNVISCDFYNNTADDTAGAIYWSANGGNILYCTFKDNNASIAGAVYGATNDEIMINNSAFINNLAKTLGGALLVEDEGFIENTEFLNNSANIGGAVYCSSESHIINSTFTRNSAEIGGALVITDGEITNSIFTNNHASDSGGAIMCEGEVIINGTTFNKNSADDGCNNIVLMDNANVTIVAATSDSQLIHKQVDMTITCENVTYGKPLRININLNENLNDGQLYISLNNRLYSFNVTNGIVNAAFSNLKAGTYNLKIYYNCSDYSTQVEKCTARVMKKQGLLQAGITFIAKNFKELVIAYKQGNLKKMVTIFILDYINKEFDTSISPKNEVRIIVPDGTVKPESTSNSNNHNSIPPAATSGIDNEKLKVNNEASAKPAAYTAEELNDTDSNQKIGLGNIESKKTANGILAASTSNSLQDIINGASEGSTIKLSKSYTPEKQISINKTMIIDGAGNTIDCSKNRIEISKGKVTLKNLIIANGKIDYTLLIVGSGKCTIINCTFKNNENTALANGVTSTLTVINSTFINNHANGKKNGGAIHSKGMVIAENSTFTNNTAMDGGAISGISTIELTNCVFSSNKATGNVNAYGGAIFSISNTYVENCTFSDNTAKQFGGAIYANGNLLIDKSTFTRNKAEKGGAIRINNDHALTVEESKFINNSASKTGGAISTEKWVNVDNSIFIGNTAQEKGGAIYTDFIQLGENVTFTSNSAKGHGGAVYTNTIGNIIKKLKMQGNHADSDFGGGLYINSKCPEINFYSCTFMNNYAIKGDGGAIHSDSGSTNLKFYSCEFTGNYATGGNERRYGGAVRSNGNVYIENSTFKDNWAENHGGAIYSETANEIKNSVFISNNVKNGGKRDGGAIYINKACTTTIVGSYFEKNGGAERGGAIYTDSKDAHLKIVNNAFIENSAGEGKSVFNSGEYKEIGRNWWGANGASMDNQLKEYHTIGSNEDHKDGSPLKASVSGSDKAYTNVKTTVSVTFQSNMPYYALNKISYATNKKGSFEKNITGNSLKLTYTPNETGTHTISFTINGQKLSFNMNVSYTSVYGYDLTKQYGSDELYSAVFKDKNGAYLPKGTAIKFNVDNVNYTGTVEDNGVAKLRATLEVGNHTVKAMNTLTGESCTNKITVTSTIKKFNMGDVYIMKLDGVINKTVSVKLGDKTYALTTSQYGIAYLPLNVSAGNYSVEIKYNGKVFKDKIVVLNRYSIIDLGLEGTNYGSLLPVYSNESFIKLSNGTMYSVLGENTYRYIMGSKQAFILYNVTVSNSDELTKVLKKISSSDFKADVIMITLKKNTYAITENFWRDSEWYYLIHLTHGKLFIDGGGSTIVDNYHHNFICLEQSSSIYIKNLVFHKFYRVFSNSGEVTCVNVTFTENNAKFFATKTPGSVIYNKNKATFENCVFKDNKNDDQLWGRGDGIMGGVLYADSASITNFVKCQFLSDDDNIRAQNGSMVIFYDDNTANYDKIIKNSYLKTFSSIDVRKVSTYNKNHTVNFNIASSKDFINPDVKNNSTLFGLLYSSNDGTSYNITLKKGQYIIKSEDLEEIWKRYEWRGDFNSVDVIPIIYDREIVTVKSKPIVINGNGATIKLTGNSISDDFHFAYIPQHGSLTLINVTLSGFNTAFINLGTLILINCTFDNNQIHHKIKVGDYGGVIRNYGDVFCYNSTFTNNAANLGGAYYSDSDSSSAVFSNCKFSGNVVKSNWVWNNNDENAFYINKGFVKFVKCSGVSSANIRAEKEGKYSFRNTLNNTIYNIRVDSLSSLMKLAATVKGNIEYDIINATFVKRDYGVFPNSEVLFEIDYGLLIINGGGARVLVQNPKDNDETQFLKTTSHSNVQINNLSIEGFNIAIENNGKLKIMNSHLNNNRVDYNSKSDYGGAIVNAGILSVLNTTFANNYAKYGGAVYNTGASKFVMCNFTNNQGYSDKKNIDIYNKEGSVEYITVNTKNPNMFEKHPMSQWKQDLIKSSIKLATLIVTATTGWGIAASEISCAAVLSTTINAIIGGAFGALDGFIYSNDHQDYGKFWASVIEGVGNGMDFTDFGEAIHELRPLLDSEMVKAGLSQIYVQFRSKTVEFAKSLAEEHEHEANFDDIDVYAFFNS